jgi:hypothetical protein
LLASPSDAYCRLFFRMGNLREENNLKVIASIHMKSPILRTI